MHTTAVRHASILSLLVLGFATGCGASKAAPHGAYAPQPGKMAGAPMDAMADEAGAPMPAAPPRAGHAPAGAPVAQAAPRPAAKRKDRKARPVMATAKRKPKSEKKRIARTIVPKPGTVIAGPQAEEPRGTEQFTDYGVNPFTDPSKDRLSTFAIDVDTASYALARSSLTRGRLPGFASVRAEEFVNYFGYEYASPSRAPFNVHLAAAPSPYERGHHLVRVGVQAKRVDRADRKPVHLVYLVDTSGSMRSSRKIGLAKKSLRMLTEQLKPGDTVAICTYAGSVREVLSPTGINRKQDILRAIDGLDARGSTAMSSGIELAYRLASRTLVKGHVNRVIVLSDGDANVGPASHQQILKRIAHFKDKGVTLSTVGFGRGNYKDTMMEQLANKGNGNYSYIDTPAEAKRVFVDQLEGLLQVVAKDVKIQVEFDPRAIARYRLIGYENRDVKDRDFRNDKVDAGEIGAGHNVTALYDVVFKPGRQKSKSPIIVRLRHKKPDGKTASESAFKMAPSAIASTFEAAPKNLRFASAVVGFAEILRKSPHARGWRLATVREIGQASSWGRKDQREFLNLVSRAERLTPTRAGSGAIMAK